MARKCICPDAATLEMCAGSVINWPRWNVDDCPIHKGNNRELEAEAEAIRRQKLARRRQRSENLHSFRGPDGKWRSK